MDCILCAIQRGDLPAPILYSDADVMATPDVARLAPIHFIVFPRIHIASLAVAQRAEIRLLGHLAFTAAEIMRGQRGEPSGWQAIYRVGPAGGQAVPHLALEILAGKHPPPPPPKQRPTQRPRTRGRVGAEQDRR